MGNFLQVTRLRVATRRRHALTSRTRAPPFPVNAMDPQSNVKDETRLAAAGRGRVEPEGTVNLPVYRASTILSPDIDSYLRRFENGRGYEAITYGANGTHNARALAEAVAALEGGARTVVTASGLSAITMALCAFASAGDHVLVTDSVYGPTRRFCHEVLSRWGVETTFYDPAAGGNIAGLFRENTRLVFLEAPGSLTFEMQDVPAIARAARAAGILTAMDNTWATPLFFKPLAHGIDLSIQAGTKYVAGHSDLVIGLVTTADEALYRRLADTVMAFGEVSGPDDCYLAPARLAYPLGTHPAPGALRARARRLARRAARSAAGALPSPALRSRPRPLATGLRGRREPLRCRARHHGPGGDRAHGRRPRALSHRLLLGRLREPGFAACDTAAP